jgi:hypothetical protein
MTSVYLSEAWERFPNADCNIEAMDMLVNALHKELLDMPDLTTPEAIAKKEKFFSVVQGRNLTPAFTLKTA